MNIDNHPTKRSFSNHVILYAKGQYKFTPIEGLTEAQTTIVHLRKLLCKWSYLVPELTSDRDVKATIVHAYNECVENETDRNNGLLEMLGWYWGQDTVVKDRDPINVMMGLLSVLDGRYVYMPEKIDIDLDEGEILVDIPEKV